jgi:outer membrane protein TolC
MRGAIALTMAHAHRFGGFMSARSTLFLALAALAAQPLTADMLSRADYLAQVQRGNSSFRAEQATDTALQLAMLEPGTKLSPRLDANLNYLDDQSIQNSPLSYSRYSSTTWDAELSKQFDLTGTHLTLGYKGLDSSTAYPQGLVQLFGSFPGFDNPTLFDSQGYYVSVQQPLWRDFGARAYEVAQAEADSNYGSARLMNRYGAAAALFQAESAYLQLAATRQIMQLLAESQERSKKILDLTHEKFNDNLVDKVDVLEADAALKQVELGLAETRRELRKNEEEFNTLRGLSPGAEVGETLEDMQAPASMPARAGERLDIQAARKDALGKEAFAEEVKERYRPDLSIFGTATRSNGPPSPAGLSNMDHPTYVVGLKFSTILDVGLYDKVVEGALRTVDLTKDDLRQKELKQDEDWENLRSQWEVVQDSLSLAGALEEVQKEKAEREKVRYQDGRTTNFQVLRFEEDFNQARINTLRLKTQAAILAAQAAFYNGGGITW